MLGFSLCVSLVAGAANPPAPAAAKPEAKDYVLTVTAPPPAAPGGSAEVVLAITPKAPWVLKLDTPFSATVSAPAGLTVEKARLDAKDFVDPKAETKAVKAVVRADTPGEHTVTTELSFFLCTDVMCKRLKDSGSAKVIVK
jgi:hypothetical protein